MTILFPNSPLDPRRVEPDFSREFEAAQSVGLDTLLLDSDALVAGDTSRALRLIRPLDDLQLVVYRGWMLRPETYGVLHEALRERNCILLNNPDAYERCHLLPNWYPLLEGRTPRSVWLSIPECFDPGRVVETARSLGSGSLIVKDYVKSRKHEWKDACFIGDCQDVAEVARVTGNFLSRQAESLVGGIVLREFVPLREVASGQTQDGPIVNEWRLFWREGGIIALAPHVPTGVDASSFEPPQVLGDFPDLAGRIESRFFSMDVAQTASGEWVVVEIGDGGVSGLPPGVDPLRFYNSMPSTRMIQIS